jgi:hypothetical protein
MQAAVLPAKPRAFRRAAAIPVIFSEIGALSRESAGETRFSLKSCVHFFTQL